MGVQDLSFPSKKTAGWFFTKGLIVLIQGLLVSGVPDPAAFFPLNGAYGTNEIKGRVVQGRSNGVDRTFGPGRKILGSYQLHGTSDSYIEFTNAPGGILDVRHSMTILCWLRYQGTDGPIFNYGGNRFGVHLWVSTGRLYVRFVKRDYNFLPYLKSNTTLESTWMFVGASYDQSTGEAKLWVDGNVVQSQNTGIGLELATQDNVRIGAVPNDTTYLKAKIGQVQLYNEALSQEQIQAKQKQIADDCFFNSVGVSSTKFIPDDQISASSYKDSNYLSTYGRLYDVRGLGWCAGTATRTDDWLQVDAGEILVLCAVSTQGDVSGNNWVQEFKLSYSMEGSFWNSYTDSHGMQLKFQRQGANHSLYRQMLPVPVPARYVRFNPTQQYNWNCMRVEMYSTCPSALGMTDGTISDGQISASSEIDLNHAATQARLQLQQTGIKQGCWVAGTVDTNQWLQIDLANYQTTVRRVATQGRNGGSQWVTSYNLQYSDNGVNFTYYGDQGQGSIKDFNANTDADNVVKHDLSPPIKARFIRFRPTTWTDQIAMRVELFGCKDCVDALGMESGAITDGQITASSSYGSYHSPSQGRLRLEPNGDFIGAWEPYYHDIDQWLQIDLRSYYIKITRIATQGRHSYHMHWVTVYNLQCSDDCVDSFIYYVEDGQGVYKDFAGNTDQQTVVSHNLSPPIRARCIRFRPKSWHNYIAMRVELYGCKECHEGLGMENGEITDAQVSASSEWNSLLAATFARLHIKGTSGHGGGWKPLTLDKDQWLQVDLGNQKINVTGVATQGRNDIEFWVTTYNLQFSDNGENFTYYIEQSGQGVDSSPKVFTGNTDRDTVVFNEMFPPITARFIRFRPLTWNGDIGLRMELYGCQDNLDECSTNTYDCPSEAYCDNTVGSFICRCKQGFTGDGRHCEDVDECLTGTHNCHGRATCTNTYGSYNCTCHGGFTGSGFSCWDINECSQQMHNCTSEGSRCSNKYGTYKCVCRNGYSGDGKVCADIDECSLNVSYCGQFANCTNTIGSFDCSCLQGYEGNGTFCAEIDECATATHNCHGVAHCYNSPGSFICRCRDGYTGDGLTCEPIGEFSVIIRNISKDKNHPTTINRAAKSVQEAMIQGLPKGASILESAFQWRLLSEAELVASESAEGTLASQGSAEWIINRRIIPSGIYQIKFTASVKISDPAAPQTLQAFDYGFIESIPGPILAIIDGGSRVRWGSPENVTVDGSLSYDGDIGPGTHTGLNFTWSCALNNSISYSCFGAFANENSNATAIIINTEKLLVGNAYVLNLTVSKDTRLALAEMKFEIAAAVVPQVVLRCFIDCGKVVSATSKLRVTSECPNLACNGSVYEWRLKQRKEETDPWENVPILPNMTSTVVNATNMIIKPNSLPSGLYFSLQLLVTSQAGSEGFGVLEFETAGVPHGGFCAKSINEGVALETEFTFECFEWEDKNAPITYEFRVGKDMISYGSSPKSRPTVLAAGQPESDYQLQINIIIKNSIGVAVEETAFVKVMRSSKFDPCFTPPEEVGEQLKSLVVWEGCKLDGLLNKGEINQGARLAMSVLKTAKAKSVCGQGLSLITITQISDTITEKFSAIKPASGKMSDVILGVINEATVEGGDGAKALEMALKMSKSATSTLVNALNDPEEPFTPELEERATSVAGCLRNVMKGASQDAGSTSGDSSSSKNNVEQASQNLQNMSDAFFGRLVRSENFVIKTDDLALALKKVSPDDVKGLSMEEGPTKFELPGNLGNMGTGDINAKMTAVKFNPYTWNNSSKAIQSNVIGLELQNGNTKINVSNLDDDIVMVIPISSPAEQNTNTSSPTEHSFLKPDKMSIRSYNAQLADVPVSINMAVVEKGLFLVKVFVKFGSRPTIDSFDHNFTNPFKSSCGNQTSGMQNLSSCLPDESSMTVVPPSAGPLYVGILLVGNKNSNKNPRQKRSCFGHGRQKRACVGFKDPPPKGVTRTVIPQYDPSTDVNYTMTITQSSCLYWSEAKDKWESEGCKVAPESNSTHLVCRCNHLTSFGGNFIQAPNPIDFDKVFTEFANLAESGNISVLVTIACAFLIYFVVLVFARRADRRDENKMCPPRHITIVDGGSYYYDTVICTGVWKDSGTTANVLLTIKGERNEHNQVALRSKGDSSDTFSRGSINGFVLITKESLGALKEITLEHDNAGENPSWFVETVTIRDRQTEEQWTFPINRWLAVEKEDGLIEVTVDDQIATSFTNQVRSRFGRKIADSHLWISVFGKASSSTFTRVQRASCCLSVLFSAMIANAMFYNIGGESEGAIRVGPFKFSLRQIIVGVQSGLIVAPVNVLIVFMFKSSKPRSKKGDKYKEIDQAQQLVDKVRDTGCMLPHVCVYLAWFLCFTTTLAAATFTLFYSLMWGKEVAEQWLSSILISNGQDIFVVQPTKVMLAVVLISLLMTKTQKNNSQDSNDDIDSVSCEIDLLSDNPKERFKRSRLEAIRVRTKKEVKLAGMTKEIVIHLIFVFFLVVVCYGNKTQYRIMMTTTLLDPFAKFDLVTGSQNLYGWLRQEFLPNIYHRSWYNGLQDEDIYIGNKISILIGMPWMRHLRIKRDSCKSLPEFIQDCYYDYSSKHEETAPLRLPGWKPLPHNTSWPEALNLCPKPWRYQTSKQLDNNPIKATYNTYEGGGYVAVLGYDEATAQGVLEETFGHGWVDRQTRAVILEFAVFNVNTNLLSIATYFYEVIATGAAYTTRRVDTVELYTTESGALLFYLICQFLFMAMALYYFILMLVHLYRQRLGFFKSVWNMVDLLMIISSVASVAFYMIRSKTVLKSIKAIRNNPYEIVHFHAALDWANWENIATAFAIFIVTVKMLNLIRFNPYVIYLFSSFRQSVGYQLSYVGFFVIIFNAFVISGMRFFGRTVEEYSSYINSVMSQFEFLLGKAVPLSGLRSENPFLGPSFAFMYMLIMTVFLMNMLVSVLNESYSDAKANAEDSAEELEMARFIGERFMEVFKGNKKRPEFKLYCDEATFVNMCQSEAEPFCLNSESIIKCTEERLEKVEKRLFVLSRRAEKMNTSYEQEETDFLDLLQTMANLRTGESSHI